ncbi:hypothetical protein VCHENC02_0866A, partial [Vibrio harveyi]
MTISIVDKHRF